MLEVFLLGVGAVLRLERMRGQWSGQMTASKRQATNEYAPLPAPPARERLLRHAETLPLEHYRK